MEVIALADFGSTFTKVTLVEAGSGRLLGGAQHPTTIATDVMEGFGRARGLAQQQAGVAGVDRTLAASSAAGGLRIVAVGLVDDLTAATAHRCALGAGAKVTSVHSGALTAEDGARARADAPDVVLFAGGTDGGEADRVLANARVLAAAGIDAAVVVACNGDAAGEVERVFAEAGHETVRVANVLPAIHRQDPEPAREAIRELFIRRVVQAKGLSSTSAFFDAVLMPTPAAVLACAELMAAGAGDVAGVGSAVILDVGGATTDVHSVLPPDPESVRVQRAGPAPARAVRTVEGDLGVRWSAEAVHDLDGPWLAETLNLSEDAVRAAVAARHADPAFVPEDEHERMVDRALATSCLYTGLARHVGRVATRYVPGEGAEVVVEGRDLREAAVVVATGGSVVRDAHGNATVAAALARLDRQQPAPQRARVVLDHGYVAAAAGLLSTVDREAAAGLLRDQSLLR